MNPQNSPWTIIGDKQRLSDLKRVEQEKFYKGMLQAQYHKQLKEQMSEQRAMKMKQIQSEKQYERNLIQQSIQNNKRQIELQKMRAQATSQNLLMMERQNEYFKGVKKEKQYLMQTQNRNAQQQLNQLASRSEQLQREIEEKKKKDLLENLKYEMDHKNYYQKQMKRNEHEFQKYKMEENQKLMEREERNRQEYLRKLKNRGMTIDYGSHGVVTENYKKSLLQRKKEEWQNDQLYLAQSQFTNNYENQIKQMKNNVERSYGEELKRQISDRYKHRVYNHERQIEEDRFKLDRQRQYSQSLELSRKSKQDHEKEQLLEYLKKQMDEKEKNKREQYLLKGRELQLNGEVLKRDNVFIQGETYDLDYHRRKQLQTVAKSIKVVPKKQLNYLGERGKESLY